jgi:hypothetical protein
MNFFLRILLNLIKQFDFKIYLLSSLLILNFKLNYMKTDSK